MTNTANSTVAFIVPVFNRWDLAEPLLRSIEATTAGLSGREILVVDDFSEPETREAVGKLRAPFRPVLNEKNLGFAASVNQAVAAVDSRLFALLNSDLVLRPGWLEPILSTLEENPAAFCVGNLQFAAADGRLDHAGVGFHQGGHPIHHRDDLEFIKSRSMREFPAVTFACVVFRRSRFLDLGGFDRRFRNGYEDIDLCLRARTRGWTSLVANRSEVGHHIASSPGRHDDEQANAHQFLQRWQPLTAILERDWEERLVLERAARWRSVRRSSSAHPQIADLRHRVLVDLARMEPGGGNGGILVFVKELLRGIHRLAPGRFQFLLLVPAATANETQAFFGEDDVIVLLPTPEKHPAADSGRTIQLTIAHGNLARSLQADLLFSPLGVSDFHVPDLPLVSIAVDVLHRDLPESLPPQDVRVREIWFDRMVNYSHSVVCISEWVAGQVRKYFPVASGRLVVARPAVSDRLAPSQGRTPAVPNVFLYPANAWPHKNHETLLVAYRQYLESAGDNGWDLVLTGHRDDSMDRIARLAKVLGIGGRVQVRGYLPKQEFARLLAETGAMVFPSLYEGFGIPILEAMHQGIPVIAGRNGSIPEVAGDACLFVNVRDPVALGASMLRMSLDADLRATLTAAGRQQARKFSFDREVKTVINTFEQAIADLETAGITWRPFRE